jgi:hypothetical protein
MTRAQEQAIARVCAKECMQRELVEALGLMMDWAREVSDEYLDGDPEVRQQFRDDMNHAREVLAKARGEAA